MSAPTKHSVSGRLLSRDGDDFTHYTIVGDKVVYWVDSSGVTWAEDFITSDGLSFRALRDQVQSLSLSGLPAVIDCGTF